MKLSSSCFKNNQKIPAEQAFCIPDAKVHCTLGANCNPDLSWENLPKGTKSLILICHDPDVPSRADDVNKEGRTIPADLPRVNFYHWVLVDIPTTLSGLKKSEYSDGITPRGKKGPTSLHGARQGVNDYTHWFANDKDMSGNYFGYDGPCPPWNDEQVHHYIFTLYALDIQKCPVAGNFSGADVLKAVEGHVLDNCNLTGLYSLNPSVKL